MRGRRALRWWRHLRPRQRDATSEVRAAEVALHVAVPRRRRAASQLSSIQTIYGAAGRGRGAATAGGDAGALEVACSPRLTAPRTRRSSLGRQPARDRTDLWAARSPAAHLLDDEKLGARRIRTS
jgi:hypothetical protein